tara:strand:+ start:72 stop:569 length:498 start_codon:yes stop_codon:yes gene_type:complete
MKILLIALSLTFGALATPIMAADIDGTVESRCTIATTVPGKYGNPNAYTLTTVPASGGQVPVIRFDTTLANAYYAQVSYPTSFSSSPSLSDNVTWTGAVTVKATGESGMSGYQTASTESGSMRQYGLSVAGSVWLQSTSVAVYGGNRAFPGGAYKAVVLAECVAQ